MKKIFILLMAIMVTLSFSVNAQDSTKVKGKKSQEVTKEKNEKVKGSADVEFTPRGTKKWQQWPMAKYEVKLNGILLMGFLNPAAEFRVHNNLTVQVDLFGSFFTKKTYFAFWNKSGNDYPLLMGALWAELRYYPQEAFHGFYIGFNIGGSYYKLNHDVVPLVKRANVPGYQIGYNLMLGYTIGYAFQLNEHWGLELSLGGGGHFDKFFQVNDNKVPAKEDRVWLSYKQGKGGWVPIYKGGLMVTYRW